MIKLSEPLEPLDFKPSIDEINALLVVKVSNNGSIESNLHGAPSACSRRTFQSKDGPKQTATAFSHQIKVVKRISFCLARLAIAN